MMSRMSNLHSTFKLRTVCEFFGIALLCNAASAGPFVDWLLNNRYSNQQVVTASYPAIGSVQLPYTSPLPYATVPYSPTQYATVMPTYSATVGSTPYTAGFLPIPQTSAALLPTGSYQTTLNNVPTTYYRPVTTLDPNTGTTVTTLQPCTSYQQQVLRVPLLNPSSYYSAYGGYGSSWQNRYSSVTGQGIAASSGQSTLSIASDLNTKSYSPVQQLPATGITMVPATNPVTTGYIPQTSFVAPATSMQPTAVLSSPYTSSYSSYTSNYPSLSSSSPPTSSSYVQADGSIVTPLGSYTSPIPNVANAPVTQPTFENTPTSIQPSAGIPVNPYQSSIQSSTGNGYTSVLPETPVLPGNPAVPQSSLDSSNSWNSNSNPSALQYNNSNSTVPAPLQDPASVVPPSLSPYSQSNQTDASAQPNQLGKLVPIDRPSPVFSRTPVVDENNASSAFVNDRQPISPFRSNVEPKEQSQFQAPQLLEPSIQGGTQVNGIRPPEGYQPKPYWRSEQQSAAPNALFKQDEKTANVSPTIEPALAVQDRSSTAHVRFASDMASPPVIPSLENTSYKIDSAAINTPSLQPNRVWGQRLSKPNTNIQISDGFEPVK